MEGGAAWSNTCRFLSRTSSSPNRKKALAPQPNNRRDEACAVLTSGVAADPGAMLVHLNALGLPVSVLSINSLSKLKVAT